MVDLRVNERKTLSALEKSGGKTSVEQLIHESGLPDAAVMRTALTLQEKGLVKVHEEKKTRAKLNDEGKAHAKKGLPERRLLSALKKLRGKASLENVAEEADLEKNSIPIALGWIQKKKWAVLDTKTNTLQVLERAEEGKDERILRLLNEKGQVVVEDLNKEQQEAIQVLKRRKLLNIKGKIKRIFEITDAGLAALRERKEAIEEVTQLTPELIMTRKWQRVKLIKFDVTAPGPSVYPGKMHPLQQIIQRAREIFLELGFTEIRGPLVETAFWNFDALFQPQDHPAREMMDTFYLASPKTGKLPSKNIVNSVASVHENGWVTGSKGWGYDWSHDEAKRLVLRTHTTAETIKYLAEHKKPPIKVFSVDRVYRNEQLTYKNTAEFHQIEGIVVDENVTLRDLMGTMKTFYTKFGLKKTEFWPCYFPYTEPSAQAMVYHPKLKRWIELCGMGIFRPEVTAPMGIKCPVLAWGGGLERLAMIELGLDDIRMLYGNRLEWLRRTPLCQ
ncbi:MAG: phenylalanine--tRNA ligase subunit alpha [Candidatus Bathyarchaeota archaeon]|nr:phenylalanine--tRNA ligase subunit alpha [Candidatus Bathyarchaeota archaeon]MDH5788535.1 phenylalanine--tRNA ligase subunit alpha [Candidatus Bathyarchaeota archaeon]